MTIDTLAYFKRIEAAGLDRKVAEALAMGVRDDVVPQLATKSDLDRLGDRLETRIETMMWKHSVATILSVLAIGSFLVRFLR